MIDANLVQCSFCFTFLHFCATTFYHSTISTSLSDFENTTIWAFRLNKKDDHKSYLHSAPTPQRYRFVIKLPIAIFCWSYAPFVFWKDKVNGITFTLFRKFTWYLSSRHPSCQCSKSYSLTPKIIGVRMWCKKHWCDSCVLVFKKYLISVLFL